MNAKNLKKLLFMKKNNLYTTILTLCCILFIVLCLSACYAIFRAAEIEYRTFPVHRQDSFY